MRAHVLVYGHVFGQLRWCNCKVNSYLENFIITTFLFTDVVTGLYTDDTLKSLIKPQIVDLFLKLQEHTTNTITLLPNKIKELNHNFNGHEADGQIINYPWETMLEKISV